MKILIVEDEALLAKQLKNMVTSLEPAAEILAHTNSVQTTTQWLQTNDAPDLVLMDIELADGQCFEIFNQVTVKSPVIFTTAYDEYALRAFKVNSIDYLLKPIKEEDLQTALQKWKKLTQHKATMSANINMEALVNELRKNGNSQPYRDRFLVKQGQKLISVALKDIAFFFAKNSVNFLITKKGQKFVVDYTLDDIEKNIDPQDFFRANRQFIISHDIIVAIHPWFNGKMKVELTIPSDEDVIVSRDKAPLLKTWLGQ
ncbi:MAG: LytTR family DNA-binding domain-containing protein [Chitinophagaceae bacterium]